MRRIVVLGGFGFFGAAIVERLHAQGMKPLIASRSGRGDLQLNVADQVALESKSRESMAS